MHYALLIYQRHAWTNTPPAERDRIHVACGEWHAGIVRDGKSVGAFGLQPPSTATTLRQDGAQVQVTDGPFVETKEILGGLEIVDCRDLDEAMALARAFPALQSGCCAVEIRPLVPGGECRET